MKKILNIKILKISLKICFSNILYFHYFKIPTLFFVTKSPTHIELIRKEYIKF